MFLKIKKGKLNEIINKAITKAGSERKLCKAIGISKGFIYRCKHEECNISKDRLQKILNFLGIGNYKYRKYILEELPENWGRIYGGINSINKKKKEGIFEETMERLRKGSSRYMKQWHKDMRENSPKEYYVWQYERFKKVGRGYRFSLKNKILVRNRLEKNIGDFLILEGFKFEYEPYINIRGKVYFPDFKIGDKIIEATEWKHPDKDRISELKIKIKDYRKEDYDTILFIPQNFRKFYKELEGHIISTLPEIKTFLMPR